MPRTVVSRTKISRYKKTLIEHYMLPGRLQTKELRKYQPIEQSAPDRLGNVQVKLPSGIYMNMSQEQYLSTPEVFIATLVGDFWNLFELAIDELDKPAVIMSLRAIMEQCYRKILQFSNSTPAEQKTIAVKSWALTHALMVRSARDLTYFDSAQDANFSKWIVELRGRDLAVFQRIKSNNYSSGAVTSAILSVYPTFHTCVTNNLIDLVYADGSLRTDSEGLVIINNYLNGYVHGNTANITDMINDLRVRQHVFRSRTIMMTAAYQVMSLVNKHWLSSGPFDISHQQTYYRRLTPHIVGRLSAGP